MEKADEFRGHATEYKKSPWQVYKTARDFEIGQRDRAVWSGGRLKDKF